MATKKGFEKPNYTQTPNKFFDELMRDLSGSEIKVTLAIIRKTFGFHKQSTRLSLKDLEDMTGLSRQAVIDGANGAEEKGMISKLSDGGVNQWVVNFLDQEETEGSLKIRPGVVNKLDQKSLKIRPPSTKETIKKKERSPNGAPPVKTQAILDLEYLEKLFAETRGVSMPDWEFDPRAAQKLWRTPLKSILTQCHSLEEAEEVVIATIEHMRADKLTFTKPVQILESALSLKADRRNGKQNGDREYVEIY